MDTKWTNRIGTRNGCPQFAWLYLYVSSCISHLQYLNETLLIGPTCFRAGDERRLQSSVWNAQCENALCPYLCDWALVLRAKSELQSQSSKSKGGNVCVWGQGVR